jgi:hypothetical protein
MKSTFKKKYKTIEHADGSLELKVRCGKFGINLAPIVTIGLVLLFFVLTIVNFFLFDKHQDHIGKDALIALFVCSALLVWMLNSTSTIILKKDGIILGWGRQLAFNDISEFGLTTESSHVNVYSETSYVYAKALGRKIRITGHMPESKASAVLEEIYSYRNAQA